MKTFLFCTCYISQSLREAPRYARYLDFYKNKTEQLGIQNIFLIEDGNRLNGSFPHLPHYYLDGPEPLPELAGLTNAYSFQTHLGRPSIENFIGWWRSFVHAYDLAIAYGFNKIIHIESDFYLFSPHLCDHIRDIRSGWHTLWSHSHNWPESAVQVICEDKFEEFRHLKRLVQSLGYNHYFPAEIVLPCTVVNKDFRGDRLEGLFEREYKGVDYVGNLPMYMSIDEFI